VNRRLPIVLALVVAILAAACPDEVLAQLGPGLVISEVTANVTGLDGSQEYVELLATRTINFAVTPYAVVFAANGTATADGWINGLGVTYGFSITSGTVSAGDAVYVGGSSMAPTGTRLRVIDVATTAGDRFGASSTSGVLGNGGASADAVAVFDIDINSITSSTVPIDAIFFGTSTGSAVVSGGTQGYQLPVNDLYSGGKMQATSFILADPLEDWTFTALGSFNPGAGVFEGARTWQSDLPSPGTSIVLAYTLAVSKTGAGTGTVTSSPAGIACGATCAYGFAAGTAVTLSAVADATASFAGWSGEGCSGIGTCQVTMSAARSVQAQFIVKTATGFVPVTPCRLIDTRLDSGPSAGAPILAPSSRRVFSLLGKCGLASGAKAISANLTVVSATVQGDLQVIAGHLTSTNTSSLSIPISRARANNAIVQLSVDSLQTIAVINPTTGSVHFILDINGYFL
jgi:hypothetical protein